MAGKTTYFTDGVLNVLRGTNLVAPANIYVKLFTALPVDDASAGTELAGGGYARQVATFAAPAAGVVGRKIVISSAITFGPASAADWPQVIGWGLCDAISAGNLLVWDELLGPGIPFVADASTDTLTATAHGLADGTRVSVRNQNGVLPTGLSAATVYFVINSATNTLKLSLTQGGAAVDITAIGNGTNLLRQNFFKTVQVGDSAQFAANQLTYEED